jgi:DNA ligase-associated metallophosphoesterase
MTRLPSAHVYRGLSLLVERAVWQAQSQTLFVADVHLGKAATYRALGQPAPAGTTRDNLDRLTTLIDSHGAARLVVLGDLFHARRSYGPDLLNAFLEWRDRHHSLEILLVRGNHDLRAGDPSREMRIESADAPHFIDGIEARHYPLSESEAMSADATTALAGHIHPTIRLHGSGRDTLRFRCFLLQGRQVILPAFGDFTGGLACRVTPSTGACAITDVGLAYVGPQRAPFQQLST